MKKASLSLALALSFFVVTLSSGYFANAQIAPGMSNPARVRGVRTTPSGNLFSFYDSHGIATTDRYAWMNSAGGMVLTSGWQIRNGRGGAQTAGITRAGVLTVASCVGCSAANAVTDPYTPPTAGTFTIHGLTAFPDIQHGTYPPSYGLTFGPTLGGANQAQIFVDDGSGSNVLWNYSAGAFTYKWAISNALAYTMSATAFTIAPGHSLVINGTTVIDGSTVAAFASGSVSGAWTTGALHSTASLTVDNAANVAGLTTTATLHATSTSALDGAVTEASSLNKGDIATSSCGGGCVAPATGTGTGTTFSGATCVCTLKFRAGMTATEAGCDVSGTTINAYVVGGTTETLHYICE